MDAKTAKRYVRSSPTIERESFTWTFTQETQKAPSAEQFRAAVKVLGGWICEKSEFYIYPNRKYHPDYRKLFYKTVAAIPEAV